MNRAWMNRTWKKYLLLLAVTAPIAGYAAWQGAAASQQQVVPVKPPPEFGGPGKDVLTPIRGNTKTGAEDARLVTQAAFRFPPANPKEPTDQEARDAAKAAAARARALDNLRKFLAGRPPEEFEEPGWKDLARARAKLGEDETVIEKQLAEIPVVRGPRAAEAAQAQLDADRAAIKKYGDNPLSDRTKAARWGYAAQARVLRGLHDWAAAEYAKALNKRPPIDDPDSTLLETVRYLRRGADSLSRQFEAETGTFRGEIRQAVLAATGLREEWAYRERLLAAFRDNPSALPPEDLDGRLREIGDLYRKLEQSPELQALIRAKVQQFCDGFIPQRLRLDSVVELDGGLVPRGPLELEFAGESKTRKLSDDPLGDLTEFNHTKQGQRFLHIEWKLNQKTKLVPTDLSKAAHAYTEARRSVPRWDGPGVNRLKEACKGHDETVLNKLVAIRTDQSPGPDVPAQVWTRLSKLAEAVAAYPNLFEKRDR